MNITFTPSLYSLIASGIALVICLVTDLKSKTICPWVCLALIVAASFEPHKDYVTSIIVALIGFLPMVLAAKFGNGGGGDALLIGALGYTLPSLFSLYMFLLASFFYVVVLAVVVIATKDRKKQLPYVPFVFAAWLVLLVFHLTGVM
jgi:Flp pilus assembly protein protease CpaA